MAFALNNMAKVEIFLINSIVMFATVITSYPVTA